MISSILVKQLIRSSTSIGANIVEAKSGSSRKDFTNFYLIALKSANETKYWICLLRDSFKINDKEISNLLNECNEISKILGASIFKLRTPKITEVTE